MTAPGSFRQRVLLAGASALVFGTLTFGAHADQSSGSATTAAAAVGQSSTTSESIVVRQKKRLLKEKNSPSAVTELGTAQIAATGVSGSAGTLLRQAPSVYVYSQGLGDNAPELTIRGLRGLEIATTLDDVPTQDLEAPNNFYLSNNIGSVFTLSQISGVSVYPGVAYPDKNTFGTIGGTIAYQSKRPSNDSYVDLIGSVGSFGTDRFGFEANSGSIDSPLGTGDNALKVLLSYSNLQTQGFIDGVSNRENEVYFAADKPYADGLSDFQTTVIYNTADGYIENEPVPLPYLNKNGLFSNYPDALDHAFQNNDNLLVTLKDTTYVNDFLTLGLTAFYRANDNQLNDYGALSLSLPGTTPSALTVNGASPFINTPAGFGEGPYFGPPGYNGLDNYGYFYGKPGETYNPYALYPTGSKYCPASYVAKWGDRAFAPCGLNDQLTGGHSDTYGIQPSALITPPDIAGIQQVIKVGGLFAKETSPSGYSYLSPYSNGTMNAANAGGGPGASEFLGGTERTIYQGYIQDKISLLDNTLHITPGGTVEGTFSSYTNPLVYGSHDPASPGDPFGYYKAVKWDRDYLPFLNVSYDFDKILPPLAGLTVYGSTGQSALFAPVGDFGPNTAGPPPGASIVHLYEGGVKYNLSNLSVTADYFYQKVDRDFGFFSFQSGPEAGLTEYSGYGQRETKGVEANVTWQVTPSIQLFGNVSHLLAKYLTSGFALDTVAEDQYGIAFKGTPETGIPDWVSTFGFDYQRKSTIVDNDSINFRFQGTYTGHQNTSYDLQGNSYLNSYNFPGLEPLNYAGCPGSSNPNGSCAAYTRYNQIIGATTYDPHGGISPFAVFGFDLAYTLPTPQLPVLKKLTFDANVQNLFDQHYFQYFYKQVSPTNCGTFTSGPFVGLAKNNYSCGTEFADGIPGQPFSVFFTVTARF